jgi:hypothetical protein
VMAVIGATLLVAEFVCLGRAYLGRLADVFGVRKRWAPLSGGCGAHLWPVGAVGRFSTDGPAGKSQGNPVRLPARTFGFRCGP